MAVVDTATILVELKEQTAGSILSFEQAIKRLIGNTKDISVAFRAAGVDIDGYENKINKLTKSKERYKNVVAQLREEKKSLVNVIQLLGKNVSSLHADTQKGASGFLSMAAAMGVGMTAAEGFQKVLRLIWDGIKLGIDTMDKMRVSTASIAGAMMTNDPSIKFAEGWGRANAVIMKTYQLVGRFVGSARELQVLAESMATFGYKMELTTKRGQDQFINFANILKIITAGQNFEIQAMQELRALDQGQNFQGAMLARRLQGLGIKDVRGEVAKWKEEGIFLEKMNELLSGYAQMSGTIAQNVDAQYKSTMALVGITMASGLNEFWYDVSTSLQKVNQWLAGDGTTVSGAKMLSDKIADAYKWLKALKEVALAPITVTIKMMIDMGVFEPKGEKSGLPETTDSRMLGWLNKMGTQNPVLGKWSENLKSLFRLKGGFREAEKQQEDFYRELDEIMGNIPREGAYPAETVSAKKTGGEDDKFLYNARRFLMKIQGELASEIDGTGSNLAQKITEAKEKIDSEFSKWFIWDDINKKIIEKSEDYKKLENIAPGVAERIFLNFKGLRDIAGVGVLRKFAQEQEQEGVSITNFMKKWGDDIAAVSEAAGDKVELATRKAADTVHKAFREFTSTEKFKKYMDSLDTIERELLQTQINVLESSAAASAGGEAGKNSARTRDIAMLSASAKVDALRRDIESMRREAEIPVKWSWNEHEVERMQLNIKNEIDLQKELDRIETARKLHKLDENQGMNDTEAKLNSDKALLAYDNNKKKIIETTDTTTQYMSQAYTSVFNDIRASFNTLFGDALRGEMKSFADYVWMITDSIRNAFSNMVAGMLTEWINGFAKMESAKSAGSWFSNLMGAGGGSAGGGAFDGGLASMAEWAKGGVFPGGIHPFAKGDVVGGPTLFRFAQGTGLMGEAGPEGILPLKRTSSGELGVQTTGGGDRNVKVEIINQSGQDIKATDSKARFNGQEMIVSIWLDAFNRNAYGLRSAMGA